VSDEGEKLQLGRARPKPARSPKPDYDDQDLGFWARRGHRWKARRRAKKTRLAAMTRPRRILRRVLVMSTWFLGLVAMLMVTTIVLFYTLTDVPQPSQLPLPQVATIQYSDGSTIARIGTVDRTIVQLDQVPASTRWAVLAAEDRGFYSEPGVSIRGTMRAAISDLTGGNTQGGSGITQQYVKNAYLSDAQSLSRKLKELMIAVKLSRQYSKDQILEFYLNTVYFGRNTYGIQAAAQAYFGENVAQLTTAQGALLAGLLRAPGYYDPATNPGPAKNRWRYVLDGMVKTGHLTSAQEAAMKFPKTKPLRGNGLGATGWKFLLKNAVLADLEAHGISADEVSAKGLTIRTTIDKNAQNAALSAIKQTFTGLTAKQRNLKNALVAVNPTNGGVLAYYGGTGPDTKGYDGQVDYNDYASRGVRPPGSSFKPYTLATVLTQTLKQTEGKAHYAIDSKVNGSYCLNIEGTKICNDPGDQTVSGPQVSIANAMKYSLNTTFDLLASEAGPSKVADTAHAMGIATTDSNGNKSLVDAKGNTTFGIGIGDYPVSVLDQANGFATLQNSGIRNDAYLVQKATSSDGQVVYTHKAHPTQAIDKKVANDVTLTMKPVAQYSGDGLSGGRASAAKTGTEGISAKSNNNSDAWMVGFTPQVSAAVWVGTGLSKPIYNAAGSPLYGADLPGKTWKMFMDTYLAGKPNLPMVSKQMISPNGKVPIPKPTYTPTTSTPTPTTPKPTFSISTGFSSSSTSAPPSSSTPPPSSSTAPSSPTNTATCGRIIGPPCTTSPAPPGG
jgi:membrane peptidoglycan carboxypeptidase